ncbi:hypothetical protein NA56DRAFT_650779 [Hyaloscypha hepaticicola]|uniref:Uncharacterized protein n=1 Tax=Hyaloscypha hepaticicola TaxID=2082293 RepID=A0A2J6PKZ4_9HELO|nr:hypothetical protein NA56DRAFT_650779 [Hyaloscypha hepaticicola]
MPGGRVSKRLQGQPPSAENSAKRTRRPNKNTLDAWQKTQAPIRQVERRKKRPVQTKAPPEPIVQQEDPLGSPIVIGDTPARDAPTSPFTFSSPLKPTKTTRPARPIFDPTVEQSTRHIVTIYFTAVIDGVRKDQTFSKTIDINDPDRESLSNLRTFPFLKYVKRWQEARQLQEHEKPRWGPWIVKVGSSKALDTLTVDDDDAWFSLLTRLRQMEKNGERDRKLCYQLYVDATFNCFDREKTPPPDSKGKVKSKAKPYTMRVTRLESPSIELSSDQEIEDTYQDDEDDDLEAPQNTKTKTRDSTTKRQLREKAARDKTLTAQEYIRQQIFSRHLCTDGDCKNEKQCCYVMKLSGNHHEVTLDDQIKWAGLVGVLPDVTIETPPADWIKGYLENVKLMERKKNGRQASKKNVKDVKDEQPAPQPAPQPVLPQVQPIIIQQPAPAPAPQPQYAPSRIYRDEYPRGRPRFQQRRPAPPQPASSPIRRPVTDLLPEFLEYVLTGKAGTPEEQRIRDAFDVIVQQAFQLDDLRTDTAVTILNQNGVPGGIALNIQRSVSGFSRNWKARQEAAQGLQNMAQQAPEYPEYPRPVPRGHATYVSAYMPDYSEGDYEFYGPGGAGSGDYYKGTW